MTNLSMLVITASIFCLLTTPSLVVAKNALPSHAVGKARSISKEELFNSDIAVLRLTDGYDCLNLKNGKFDEGDGFDGHFSDFVLGTINGVPHAVVFLVWGTGGSGVWEELALFRKVGGKLSCVGVHCLQDRGMLDGLSLNNNRVSFVYRSRDSNIAETDSAPKRKITLLVKDFDKCNCK